MNYRVVKCAVCGKEFETSSTRQCCSEECLKIRQREYQRLYKQRGRQKRAERKERTAAGKKLTCPICGKEVPKGRSKFCSDACMLEARRRYHAEYRRIHRNEVLEKDRLRWRERYRPIAPTIRMLVCPQCGKRFSTSNPVKIFCCKGCKDRWNTLPEDRRIDLRDPEALRKARERAKADAEQLVEQKRQADEQRRHEQYMRDRIRRTEKGAVWYPVSTSEIQRIARETHRTYGEVCAEFLSRQVRGTAGGRTE